MTSSIRFATFNLKSDLSDGGSEKEVAECLADQLDAISLQEVEKTNRPFIQTLKEKKFTIYAPGENPDTAIALRTSHFEKVVDLSDVIKTSSSQNPDFAAVMTENKNNRVPLVFLSANGGQDRAWNQIICAMIKQKLQPFADTQCIFGGQCQGIVEKNAPHRITEKNIPRPHLLRRIWSFFISIFRSSVPLYTLPQPKGQRLSGFSKATQVLNSVRLEIVGGPSKISQLWHSIFG